MQWEWVVLSKTLTGPASCEQGATQFLKKRLHGGDHLVQTSEEQIRAAVGTMQGIADRKGLGFRA